MLNQNLVGDSLETKLTKFLAVTTFLQKNNLRLIVNGKGM